MATGTAIGQRGNWRGRYSLAITHSDNETTVVCSFYVEHVKNAGKLERYHYRGTFDGTNGSTYYPSSSSLGCTGNGNGETVSIGSVTKTYPRTFTEQTLTKAVKVTNTDTSGSVSTNVTITIPARTVKVKNNGTWEDGVPSVKVSGAWADIVDIYVKVNGNWLQI